MMKQLRRLLGALIVMLVGIFPAVNPLSPNLPKADASIAAGKCSEASGTMTCNVSGQSLNFGNLPAMVMTVGNSYTATEVFTSTDSTPVKIDAVVTITEVVGGSISKSGGNISASISGSDTIAFRVDFKTNSDGSSVLMQNIEVRVDDIDGGGQKERAEFSGLQRYTLADPTQLVADPAGENLGSSETGTRTFIGGITTLAASTRAVSVLFESVSSIGMKAFDEGTGGVITFSFGDPGWGPAVNHFVVGNGEYTITYDVNGGSGDTPAATTGRGGQALASGAGLSKGGINISSWNTAANGSGVTLPLGPDESYTPVSDVTLYAQYETQTVIFDKNGGSGELVTQDAAGTTALTPNSYTRDGFEFAGWNTAADYSGAFYADEADFPFSVDRTLYAQWATSPGAPTNVSGSVSSRGGDVDLSWTAGADNNGPITSYVIEARKNGTSSWSSVTDSDGNAANSAATISGLDSCTLYDFRVAAVNVAGTGPFSSVGTGLAFGSAGLTSIDASRLVLGGDATVDSGLVTLTTDEGNKKGAAWSPFRVDLSESFCLQADIKLSDTADTSGADGVAFVLQPTDTSTLSTGGGLGYLSDVNPSVAVEFDTYPNGAPNDSANGQDITLVTLDDSGSADHTGFGRANYDVTGDGYALEDGEFHNTRVAYDANSEIFTVLVDLNADGDFADTGERSVDDVSADLAAFFTTEASTSLVYWGWTAATGGATNLQQVQNVKALPASTAGNTSPTATSPGAQTLAVGATSNVSVTIGDNGETTAAQWRLSVSSGNTSFATATVSVASATSATVALAGVADGDTTITLTAVDADGASVSTSFALRVGAGSPEPPSGATSRTSRTVVVVPPVVPSVISPRVTLTPQNSLPVTQSGPVLLRGVVPIPPKAPMVVVGGEPTVMTTTVPTTTQLDVRAGQLNLGVKVLEDQGQISEAPDGTTEIAVRKGAAATITGSGFRPGATVQVFMPLQGDNAKELTRIPVQPDGSFDGSAPFATRPREAPLPIGKNVLQLVSLDNDGNQVVVEMTVNIAQGAPAPEQNRIDGAIPTMTPGQSVATSGGEPVPVTITPVSDQKLAVVEGDGWTMAVNVNSEQGGVEPAEGGALLKLVRNESALVSGSGFMPGTRADVWLFSDPTLLGTVTIDENGEFIGEVSIDPNMIPVGEHTLQLQGVGEDGYVKAANMGVLVDDPAETVADTATASLTFLWWVIAAVLVILVLVLILASRRRRNA